MRLSSMQQKAIVESIREAFGADARTFLFGSRIDDTKYGGDIDLLVEVPLVDELTLPRKIRAVGVIQRKIGEQKIDMIITDGRPEQEALLIVRNARKQGLPL